MSKGYIQWVKFIFRFVSKTALNKMRLSLGDFRFHKCLNTRFSNDDQRSEVKSLILSRNNREIRFCSSLKLCSRIVKVEKLDSSIMSYAFKELKAFLWVTLYLYFQEFVSLLKFR